MGDEVRGHGEEVPGPAEGARGAAERDRQHLGYGRTYGRTCGRTCDRSLSRGGGGRGGSGEVSSTTKGWEGVSFDREALLSQNQPLSGGFFADGLVDSIRQLENKGVEWKNNTEAVLWRPANNPIIRSLAFFSCQVTHLVTMTSDCRAVHVTNYRTTGAQRCINYRRCQGWPRPGPGHPSRGCFPFLSSFLSSLLV